MNDKPHSEKYLAHQQQGRRKRGESAMTIVPHDFPKTEQAFVGVNAVGELTEPTLAEHFGICEALIRWKAAEYPPGRELEELLWRDCR